MAGIAAMFMATGCTPLIAGYSLTAYSNATTLKAETLATIDLAVDPYPQHADQVRTLQTKLDAAYEFAHGTPYNSEAAQMWDIIRNPSPEHSLLGTFFDHWRTNVDDGGKPAGLTKKFIADKKSNVIVAFDRLICLEANKQQATKCAPLPGATQTTNSSDTVTETKP